MSRRKATAIASSLWLALFTGGQVTDAATEAATVEEQFKNILNRYCPTKHLEWLSEGDRDLAIQEFRVSLASSQRAQLDAIANPEHACPATTVGLECNNIAYIRAALELNLLPQLGMKFCSAPIVCGSVANCTSQR